MDKFLLLLTLNCIFLGAVDSYAYQSRLTIQSDTLTIQSWTVDDGLPVNTLNTMVQDDIGYLWFSTYDGLVRFDGLEFEIFNHVNTPAFPHNRITNLHFQENVGLWISLEYGGIILYQDNTFRYFGPNEGFTESNIRRIIELSNHRLLLLTNKGLFEFEEGKFFKPFENAIKSNQFINDVFEDSDGSIWISAKGALVQIKENGVHDTFLNETEEINNIWSTIRFDKRFYVATNKGLFRYTDDKFVRDKRFNLLNTSQVRYLHKADDYLLVISDIGLYSFKNNILTKLSTRQRNGRNHFSQIHKDSNNKFWLISQDGRLIIFNDGELNTLDDILDIENVRFNNFFEDRESNKWLLTTRNGLIRLGNSKVRTIGVTEGLSGSNVLGLLKDSKDNVWVGTRGDGLNKIERDKIFHFGLEEGLSANTVHTVSESPENIIWIGYPYSGLGKIENGKVTNYDVGSDIESNDVRSITFDKSNQMWIGTYQGLVKFDYKTNTVTRLGKNDGLNGVKIRYLVEDQDSAIWIGTLDGGISKFKNKQFTNFTKEDGLSSNNIRSIYIDEDEAGVLWVGTENNGLNRFKNGEFSFVNVEDGLPDYNIHWISQDEFGWLWMSSNKGVFKILKSELNDYLDGNKKYFQLIAYGTEDGMRNPEGNGSFQEAGLRTKDGKFYFATQEGVAIFNSKSNTSQEYEPQVIIKELDAEGQKFYEDTVSLDSKINVFSIRFQSLSYANNSGAQFRYRFVNRDSSWTNLGSSRELTFSSLQPGKYHIEVQASNGERGWTGKTASILVIVNPKYYQQVWFYVLVLAVLIALYYIITHFRYRILIARQERLEKIINEQTEVIRLEKEEIEKQKEIIEIQAADLKESNKTKDKFFSIIAHDLRNPFQAMVGYSEMLLLDYKNLSEEELQEQLEIIQSSSIKLLGLTNNLLSWANLQTGKISSEPLKLQLNSILEKNINLFEQSAIQKNIELRIGKSEIASIYADPNMIDTIVRNLISNALKFTPKGGKIEISLKVKGERVLLKIQDNGIGMDENTLKNLFSIETNSSRDGTEQEQGSGLGLVLCKDMIDKNNGNLLIESEDGKGTTVSVEFPIYKERT